MAFSPTLIVWLSYEAAMVVKLLANVKQTLENIIKG